MAHPSPRATLHAGIDPAAQVPHALFSGLYPLIEAAPVRVSPQLAPGQTRVLRRAYGAMPSPAANDGIVPKLSQAGGRVIHAAVADHLDVLGHFPDAEHDPPHVDWLVSGSDLDRPRFEARHAQREDRAIEGRLVRRGCRTQWRGRMRRLVQTLLTG